MMREGCARVVLGPAVRACMASTSPAAGADVGAGACTDLARSSVSSRERHGDEWRVVDDADVNSGRGRGVLYWGKGRWWFVADI